MDDTISRQVAIDAVKRLSLGETDATRLAMRMGDYLERLVSAQPEVIRCKDCVHSDTFPEGADNDMPLKCLGIRYGGVMPDWYCEHAEKKEDWSMKKPDKKTYMELVDFIQERFKEAVDARMTYLFAIPKDVSTQDIPRYQYIYGCADGLELIAKFVASQLEEILNTRAEKPFADTYFKLATYITERFDVTVRMLEIATLAIIPTGLDESEIPMYQRIKGRCDSTHKIAEFLRNQIRELKKEEK